MACRWRKSTVLTTFLALASPSMAMAKASTAQRPAPLPADARVVSAAGMQFRFFWQGETLVGELRGPSQGWLAVGLHTQPGLEGSHFLMMARGEKALRIEEHRADPPRHKAIPSKARILFERSGDGISRYRFEWPKPLGKIKVGDRVHGFLAWSVDTDFQHHSRQREHFKLQL